MTGAQLTSVVHPSRASYNRAVQETERAPVAEGSTWHSRPANEFEEIKKDGRHLLLSGREFLSQVYVVYDLAATDEINNVGQRIDVRMLSPQALGGRIQLIAQSYESHRARKFRVTYAPVVPTTTTGAIALAFVNDVATTQQLTGIPEMVHLSSAEDFVEFPVWQTSSLDIDPDSFTRQVADEQEGDARFTTDGLLVVLSAGPLIVPGPGSFVAGNLFISYEYEFTAPLLDQDISTPIGGSFTLTAGAATTTTAGSAVSGGSGGGVPAYFTIASTTGLAIMDTCNYIMCVTVQALTLVAGAWPNLRVLDDSDLFTFLPGQTFFIRSALSPDGTGVFCFLFNSLESASDFEYDGNNSNGALSSGQLIWNATSVAGTNQYIVRCIMSAVDVNSGQY